MVRKERKNAQKDAQTAPKTSPLQFELPGAFYRPWHSFWGPKVHQRTFLVRWVELGWC